MERHNEDDPKVRDGRPVEMREGEEPQSQDEREEDIPDASTVESVGY